MLSSFRNGPKVCFLLGRQYFLPYYKTGQLLGGAKYSTSKRLWPLTFFSCLIGTWLVWNQQLESFTGALSITTT